MPGSLRALIRAGFLVGVAAYLGISSGCERADEQSAEDRPSSLEHPNVVIIIIDALRPDQLGAYGFDAPTSPELDTYARKGVRFARVIAQSTWTRPSIGSMLTSLHPRTLGIYKEKDEVLASRFVTLAEVLKEHGYWTAGATANPNINRYYNFAQGFDYYLDSDTVFPSMPGFKEQAASGSKMAVPRARSMLLKLSSAIPERRQQPVYLQVNLMEVHQSHKIPELTGEHYDSLESVDPSLRNTLYIKAVRHLSIEIDLFIRSLSRRPGWEDTLFVITSDHGESLVGDHPDLADPKFHGYLVYETQALVPLILYRASGELPAGRVIDRPVRLLDLMPTLLEYVGIPGPSTMAGTSLMPLLRDPAGAVNLPEQFVVETQFKKANKAAVYSKDWIYVENYDQHAGTGARAIQKVGAAANGSLTDGAGQHPQVIEELSAHLKRWKRKHPRTPPTSDVVEMSDEALEQLRELGYVE
jgi:arylsulfatase A-like enzyme